MPSFKLQSATEYLMTYSWAILIIALVVAALFAIGLFKPSVGTQCILPGGLACSSVFLSSNGLLTINLLQVTTAPINVTSYGCNKNNTVAHMYCPNSVCPAPPDNQVRMLIGANYTFNVECWSGGSAYNGVVGGAYTGYIIINYTDSNSGFPHTVEGQLALSVS